MWFSISKTVVILKKQSIEFMTEGDHEITKLSWPEQIVFSQEVQNAALFQKYMADFLATRPNKQHVIIVMSAEIIYSFKYEAAGADTVATEAKFYLSVPFAQSALLKKKFIFGKFTYLFSANKQFLLAVVNSMKSQRWNIKSVVPAFIFQEAQNEQLTADFVLKSLKSKQNLIELTNVIHDIN